MKNVSFARIVSAFTAASVPSFILREAFRTNRERLPQLLLSAEAIPAGPPAFHSGSVLDHLCRVMDAVAGSPRAVWMAFAHDLGKLTTPRDILPHHYGHELRGKALARELAGLASLPDDWRDAGIFCAEQHMRAGMYLVMKYTKRRDLLVASADAGCFEDFWKVVSADRREPLLARAGKDYALLASVPSSSPKARERQVYLLRAACPTQGAAKGEQVMSVGMDVCG